MNASAPEAVQSIEADEREETTESRPLNTLRPRKFNLQSVASGGLFILALFYTIYFMRAVLLPLVLALLLSYLLRPIVRALGAFIFLSPFPRLCS